MRSVEQHNSTPFFLAAIQISQEHNVRCSQCGHENPFGNFFCGHCGAPLLQRPPAPQPDMTDSAPVAPEAAPQPEGRITGPSFLGLSEQQGAEEHSLEYLYEDEPTRRYGRLIVALLVLVTFGAFIAYQWKQRPNWYTALNNPFSKSAAQTPDERASADVPAGSNSAPNVEANESAQTPAPAASSADSVAQAPATQSTTPIPVPQADAEQTSAVEAPGDAPRSITQPATDEGSALLSKGLAYLNGTGVPRSCSQALVYLNSAARTGNARANSQLGGLYATGHCVPMDRAKAYQYFTRARNAEHGRNVYIEHTRAMLWSQMSDAEKTQTRAAESDMR
jgi:hypothetical protein